MYNYCTLFKGVALQFRTYIAREMDFNCGCCILCYIHTASVKMKNLMTLSIWCNTSIEDVAEANGSGLRWLQISIFRDRTLTESLINRAERAGYQAIVVTVDQPTVGLRTYRTFIPPEHISFPNLGDVPSPLMVEDVRNLLNPSHT